MSKHFCAMMIVLLVASCGGGPQTAPRDLDNACTILKEHPDYLRAFRATERKWGVPIHVPVSYTHLTLPTNREV